MRRTLSQNEERHLVDRCLNHDESAWFELVDRYESGLHAYVRKCLRGRPCASFDANDIAQAVWCALFVPDVRRLQAFQPEVGNLQAYLNALALQEIQRTTRSDRHRNAEVALTAAESVLDPQSEDWMQGVLLTEVKDLLSRQALATLQEQLGNASTIDEATTTMASRQRRHRLTAMVQRILQL